VTAPIEHPPHIPYEGERGWHYRCDVMLMSWGPWPSEDAVASMIKAHSWSCPECRPPRTCDPAHDEHVLPHVGCVLR